MITLFRLIFACFVSIGFSNPYIYSSTGNVDHINNVHSIPRKNEAVLDDYVQYFGISYFLGEQFLVQFTNYLQENQHATSGDYNNWNLSSNGDVEFIWDLRSSGSLRNFNIANDGTIASYGVQEITGYTWRKTTINSQRNDYWFELNYQNNYVIRFYYRAFFNLSAHDITANNPYDALVGNIVVDSSITINTGYQDSYKYFGMYSISYYQDSYLYEMTHYDSDYEIGYNDGFSQGKNIGYNDGYNQAQSDLSALDSTANTIFSGILDVGLLPVNVFLLMLNFEVFGINVGGFISSLLTVAVVIIIIRLLLGGKKND